MFSLNDYLSLANKVESQKCTFLLFLFAHAIPQIRTRHSKDYTGTCMSSI